MSYAFGLLTERRHRRASLDGCARRCCGSLQRARRAHGVHHGRHARTTTRTCMRPALFPPSDGYEPPEDPLRGVARHIDGHRAAEGGVSAAWRSSAPGYTYLQEWLPHVAQHSVRDGLTDFVGLGRMVLAYPELAGRRARRAAAARASRYAARSATARPGRASAWCPGVTRSIRSTRSIRDAARLREREDPDAHMMPPHAVRASIAQPVRSRSVTAFLALFAIVGFALYGLPRFYPFYVQELGLDAAAGHVGQRLQQDGGRARCSAFLRDAWSIDSDRGV